MKILVVDDERPWCTTVKDIFTPLGHEVETAQDVNTGLNILKSKAFDVVILDKNVPTEKDGFEFLEEAERLKIDPKYFSHFIFLNIIMLTAYPSFESIKKTFGLNLYDYIEKDDRYSPNLEKDIKEIDIIRKFNFITMERKQILKLFEIEQLKFYFDKLLLAKTSTEPFTMILFGFNVLSGLNIINEDTLKKLFIDTGIIKEIPGMERIENEYHRFFNELALEIVKNGRRADLFLFKKFVDGCLKEDKYILPPPAFSESKIEHFIHVYKLLVHFDLIVDSIPDEKFRILIRKEVADFKSATNAEFVEYTEKKYPEWVVSSKKSISFDKPTLSPNIISGFARSLLKKPTCLLVFDGMRLGQWFSIRDYVEKELRGYHMEEKIFLAVLPTATTYARNSLLSGLFPVDIANNYNSAFLKNNAHELELLKNNSALKNVSVGYLKRAESRKGDLTKLIEDPRKSFKVFIFNFVDELGHIMHAIGGEDHHFRKHVRAGFKDSIMIRTLKEIAKTESNILITTDHGNIRISKTVRIGNYLTTISRHSRYALVDKKIKGKRTETITVTDPISFGLPDMGKQNYIFAKGDVKFMGKADKKEAEFVHGGISMEEMIVPFIVMTPNS